MQAVTLLPGRAGSQRLDEVLAPGVGLGAEVRADRSRSEQVVTRRIGPDVVEGPVSRAAGDVNVVVELATP